MTTAADMAILLPVVNGNLVNCCRPNVKFVRVQITLNFCSLVSIEPPGITTLQVEYYIELPQMSRAMVNGASGGYNLVTYHGANNLRTLQRKEVQATILDQTLQDGPYDLQPASFNLTMARTDGTLLRSKIEGKILHLAYLIICNTLFLELCPGYSNQPHAVLDHIRQVHYNRNGNQVVSSIQAYFQQMINALHPFSSQHKFPISVCQKFQDGLDPVSLQGSKDSFLITVSSNCLSRRTSGRHSSRYFKLLNRQRLTTAQRSLLRVRRLGCSRLSLLAPNQVDPRLLLHFQARRRPCSPGTHREAEDTIPILLGLLRAAHKEDHLALGIVLAVAGHTLILNSRTETTL
jgi:hypothetical protein